MSEISPADAPKLRVPDNEKVTVNLGYVDLGHIDLLVAEGFYSNRTDFIRTAIRNQLAAQQEAVRQVVTRKALVLGLQRFGRAELEAVRRAGEALDIRVLPGITAMLAAAAKAGAPLGHDFCAINLSDNLKPTALIEARVRAAAGADFALAFYNPRSASRPETFGRILEVLRQECGPERLVIFARAVSTPEEAIHTVALREATPEMADMRTVVIVGYAATRRVGRFVYTPRSALPAAL